MRPKTNLHSLDIVVYSNHTVKKLKEMFKKLDVVISVTKFKGEYGLGNMLHLEGGYDKRHVAMMRLILINFLWNKGNR